ncbi:MULTISPECIES: deaminase domain-containing protein [unclassified Pseudomonas]|uniref:deaminase domain-containing protein n=1 Tax=unclassified Pseudomonas TaxID=196821 RepID=UPI001CBB8D46
MKVRGANGDRLHFLYRKRGLSPFFLETIAQRLERSNQNAVGTINLISEKFVCPSCTDMIRRFCDRCPKLQLNLFTVED